MQGVHSMESKSYYVYLLTNKQRHNIYVGLTSDLSSSVRGQKFKVLPKSLSECLCTHLVYFERYQYRARAEARKTQLKRVSLCKKIALIERTNPGWCRLGDCTEVSMRSSCLNHLPA
jgi:putative endonuclease